ncbi:uncharacterized protein LOC131219611 [Magnolia sinica]|uniref:uncharacterized protein LOC131219611 n=1 Tax=Magnolia sinica TaxID=86752 RepID=UPI00265AE5BB|nr:uncharacterized protein LOC131219611 [Magnolia sinica]
MKASLKFREDQKPLVRAKIPLSVLGLPFLSGISAGDSKELCLNLSTFFESGPSLKVSYRPNDSWNPFSLAVKTGIGSFGSPISAPMAMSAEFNLLGRGNPSFFLQFKPQIGDFSFKKTSGSAIVFPTEPSAFFGRKINGHEKDPDTDGEGSIDGVETPVANGAAFRPVNGIVAGKENGFQPDVRAAAGGIVGFLSGVEVSARTALPLRSNALLKFRWGVRFPAELRGAFLEGSRRNPTADISMRKIPLLVMSKISIEHVAKDEKKESGKSCTPSYPFWHGNAGVAEACFSVRRQLEALQEENGLLRKAVEELRSDICAGRSVPVTVSQDSGKYDRAAREGGKSVAGKRDRRSDSKAGELTGLPAAEGDVNDELKKALMAATGAGI